MASGGSRPGDRVSVGEMVRYSDTEPGLRPLREGENIFLVPAWEVVAVVNGLAGTQVVTLRPVGGLAQALASKAADRTVTATIERGWRERP